jgi:hypothetical protein
MTGRPFYFLDLTCCNPWSVTSLKDVHRGRRFAGSCRAVRAAGERMPHAVSIGEAHGARGRIFRARSRTLRRSIATANPEGRIADAHQLRGRLAVPRTQCGALLLASSTACLGSARCAVFSPEREAVVFVRDTKHGLL